MAPDRPDSSNMETAVSKVYNLDEIQRFNECTISDGAAEATSEAVTKGKGPAKKGIQQSDDELTSLSWLHQQNLLKGLEISKTSKDEVALNNNNVSDESAEFGSSANSCDVDDECSSETEKVVNGNSRSNGRHLQPKVEPARINNVVQSNQTKISLNNNNLPYLNRNKHPTHIPYDPHLHRSSKPPYSFSCLIFMAIEDSPVKALPVKEVYAWILEHFPYFRNAPTGWKNSVRHNLSLNKCFRKVEKAPNLGKGSLWMVDAQYRPNLIQALSRAPFPPPSAQSISSPEKAPKKSANNRLPDPVLFPYLSKRLASSNICDNIDPEFDSDVDAAAAAMLSFKHGPIILNHNKDRKKRPQEPEKLVPIITRSSSEDHTYSCITSIKLESKKDVNQDSDEQRKIAEGADALLNLAGVSTMHNHSHVPNNAQETTITRTESTVKSRKRPLSNDRLSSLDKRRRRWRDWGENTRYLKQVKG